MQASSRLLALVLEIVAGALLVALTVLVSVAATLRYLGTGISFYDEVAPILLAWVTFFGAALVALNRGHLGFDNVVRAHRNAKANFVVRRYAGVPVYGWAAIATGTALLIRSCMKKGSK